MKAECTIPAAAAAATKSLQSCPNLYNPIDGSPPDSSIPGILQARILERLAIPSSIGFPDPEIEPVSPALEADPLLSDQG